MRLALETEQVAASLHPTLVRGHICLVAFLLDEYLFVIWYGILRVGYILGCQRLSRPARALFVQTALRHIQIQFPAPSVRPGIQFLPLSVCNASLAEIRHAVPGREQCNRRERQIFPAFEVAGEEGIFHLVQKGLGFLPSAVVPRALDQIYVLSALAFKQTPVAVERTVAVLRIEEASYYHYCRHILAEVAARIPPLPETVVAPSLRSRTAPCPTRA